MTYFRRSVIPSCIRARLSLLTGLHPATTGLVGYAPIAIKHPTFSALLNGAGYTTVLVGRNMHQNPPNKSIGYQQEFLGSTSLSDDDCALRVASLLADWRTRTVRQLAGRLEGFSDGTRLIAGRPYPSIQARVGNINFAAAPAPFKMTILSSCS